MPPTAATATTIRTAVLIFFFIFDFGGRFISMALLQEICGELYWPVERAATFAREGVFGIELSKPTFTRRLYSSPGKSRIKGCANPKAFIYVTVQMLKNLEYGLSF